MADPQDVRRLGHNAMVAGARTNFDDANEVVERGEAAPAGSDTDRRFQKILEAEKRLRDAEAAGGGVDLVVAKRNFVDAWDEFVKHEHIGVSSAKKETFPRMAFAILVALLAIFAALTVVFYGKKSHLERELQVRNESAMAQELNSVKEQLATALSEKSSAELAKAQAEAGRGMAEGSLSTLKEENSGLSDQLMQYTNVLTEAGLDPDPAKLQTNLQQKYAEIQQEQAAQLEKDKKMIACQAGRDVLLKLQARGLLQLSPESIPSCREFTAR